MVPPPPACINRPAIRQRTCPSYPIPGRVSGINGEPKRHWRRSIFRFDIGVIFPFDRTEALKKGAVGVTAKNKNWTAISAALTRESQRIQCDRTRRSGKRRGSFYAHLA